MKALKFMGFGILGIGFIALAVFITMSLWNALIPVLFNGPLLSFWQTAGIFILSKILFTGVAPGRRDHSRNNRKAAIEWRTKFREKYGKSPCSDTTQVQGEPS